MRRSKAGSPRKDWYSVSVDTLRVWGFLLAILAGLGLAYLGYRTWERTALQREAAAMIEEVRGLVQNVQQAPRAANFRSEYEDAWKGFEQARADFGGGRFREALQSAQRSRNLLLSILDALALPGSAGQAQFISVQGEVEYRRAGAADWEEARSRSALRAGDYVRSGNGSAEIMFVDGTLYTVRPNTQFIVTPVRPAAGSSAEQSIQMEYGWVDLNTANRESKVGTPGVEARVRQDSEAFVAFDKASNRGRFGALRGGLEVQSKGGLKREVSELQEVVQTGDLLSQPQPLPGRPEPVEPADNLEVNPAGGRKLVLAWKPVDGAARYNLQVSRNHLFVDNVIEDENRTKTRATLGLRGEGSFLWRVAAYGRDGAQGPWSEPRKFRIASFQAAAGAEGDETPPQLDLEDVKAYGSIFIVGGKSEPGSRVEINGEQVKVAADGSFTKTIQLTKEGWSFVEIRARDGWGNETVRRHRVFVENP